MWMTFSLLAAIHHRSIRSFLSLAPILLFKTLGILATSLALKSLSFLMFFISINNATYISYLSMLIFLGPNLLAHWCFGKIVISSRWRTFICSWCYSLLQSCGYSSIHHSHMTRNLICSESSLSIHDSSYHFSSASC